MRVTPTKAAPARPQSTCTIRAPSAFIRVHPRLKPLAGRGASPHPRPRRPNPPPPTTEAPTPRLLLPGRRRGPRSRRQHLQRRDRPVIRIPEERPPLRLGHVLPARIRPHRVLVRLEAADVVVRLVAVHHLGAFRRQRRLAGLLAAVLLDRD